METMTISGREYPVVRMVKVNFLDHALPLVDIPMMSDERWEELTRQNAIHSYTCEFGRPPESVEAALLWQRAAFTEGGSLHEAQAV